MWPPAIPNNQPSPCRRLQFYASSSAEKKQDTIAQVTTKSRSVPLSGSVTAELLVRLRFAFPGVVFWCSGILLRAGLRRIRQQSRANSTKLHQRHRSDEDWRARSVGRIPGTASWTALRVACNFQNPSSRPSTCTRTRGKGIIVFSTSSEGRSTPYSTWYSVPVSVWDGTYPWLAAQSTETRGPGGFEPWLIVSSYHIVDYSTAFRAPLTGRRCFSGPHKHFTL
jgi:hypothetical protein